MTTSSNLKNQKMHKTNIKRHRKQRKKELANRKEKKQQQVTKQAERTILMVDEREPKEIVDKLRKCPNIDVKPISPARRAFQDI